MPRYIDAEGLNLYDDLFMKGKNDSGVWVRYKDVERLIRNAPTADVEEVRHGEWEDDADDPLWGNHIVKKHCSECGYTPKFDRETQLFDLTKRCPECGAKMDGKSTNRWLRERLELHSYMCNGGA